jgi:phage baseplate assembly protein W
MASDFLGRGPSFPFRLDPTGTKPSLSSDEDLVFESIEAILNTSIGERPHRIKNGIPYGTSFRSLLFNNVDGAIDLARYEAKRSLDTWEPRIIVTSVDASKMRHPESSLFGIVINIVFRYRATNRSDNYVSFYRTKPQEEVT